MIPWRCDFGGAAWIRGSFIAIALAFSGPLGGAYAQEINGQGGEEIRLLRESAARETAGDLAGAEQILRSILRRRPTSMGAILSLERVLRVQGRLDDLIPAADRLLAEDPSSTVGHQLRVRTLSDLGRTDEMEKAMEAWIRTSPTLETPYREVARVWKSRGDDSRALKVLERGRSRLRRDDALALELGEAYMAVGDSRRAVEEWNRAVGRDARGFTLVRRRIAEAPNGGDRLLPMLVDVLSRSPSTTARQRAAAELAVDAGLGARAVEIAREAAGAMSPAERQSFVAEMARRADGARVPELAYWAYSAMLAANGPEGQQLAIRSRLGELALVMGDTAAAREHLLAVEQGYEVGSPERRQAAAVRIELTAREGRADDAVAAYLRYRKEFPDAPEVDGLAATLADLMVARGDTDGADRILDGVDGPRTSLVRGRVALLRGELTAARAAFLAAAPKLSGTEATETISLATLLGRLTPVGGKLLARATAIAGRGEVAEAVDLLTDPGVELGREDRAAILDFAAGLADRAGLPAESERIRREIVTDYAEMPEAPAALLALARALVARPGGLDEARTLFERLVLEYPRSALVPQARRELGRMQGRGSST